MVSNNSPGWLHVYDVMLWHLVPGADLEASCVKGLSRPSQHPQMTRQDISTLYFFLLQRAKAQAESIDFIDQTP